MSTFKNMPAIVDLQRCVPDAVKSSILRNRNLGTGFGLGASIQALALCKSIKTCEQGRRS
jgi:hypothetical protein